MATDDFVARVGAMTEASIEALQEAIRNMHGCASTFVERVPIREMHDGAVVWDGEVCVFDITGHPKALRCYAWSHATTGEKRRFVAVLGLGPVDSARSAVQAAIVAEARAKRN